VTRFTFDRSGANVPADPAITSLIHTIHSCVLSRRISLYIVLSYFAHLLKSRASIPLHVCYAYQSLVYNLGATWVTFQSDQHTHRDIRVSCDLLSVEG
jgi:hypothetical protein